MQTLQRATLSCSSIKSQSRVYLETHSQFTDTQHTQHRTAEYALRIKQQLYRYGDGGNG